MEDSEFAKIYNQLKDALAYEGRLKMDIKLTQEKLEKLQQQKMELILAIANKDLYNKIFGNKQKGEEKNV